MAGRGQHHQRVGVPGHQRLQQRGVDGVLGADGVLDGVAREQLERDRHVAEGEVEVDQADLAGALVGQREGEVDRHRGLADPTLGGEDGHDPAGVDRTAGTAQGDVELVGALQRGGDRGRVAGGYDVADAGRPSPRAGRPCRRRRAPAPRWWTVGSAACRRRSTSAWWRSTCGPRTTAYSSGRLTSQAWRRSGRSTPWPPVGIAFSSSARVSLSGSTTTGMAAHLKRSSAAWCRRRARTLLFSVSRRERQLAVRGGEHDPLRVLLADRDRQQGAGELLGRLLAGPRSWWWSSSWAWSTRRRAR